MSFFNDTYCHNCERLITKEQWNKHFYSSTHLHRELNGFRPAYVPERKFA